MKPILLIFFTACFVSPSFSQESTQGNSEPENHPKLHNQWHSELFFGLGSTFCVHSNYYNHYARTFESNFMFGGLINRRIFLHLGLSPLKKLGGEIRFNPDLKFGYLLNKFTSQPISLMFHTGLGVKTYSGWHSGRTDRYYRKYGDFVVGAGFGVQVNLSKRMSLLIDGGILAEAMFLDNIGMQTSASVTYSVFHQDRKTWSKNPELFSEQIKSDSKRRKELEGKSTLMAQGFSPTIFSLRYEYALEIDKKLNTYLAASFGYGAMLGIGANLQLKNPTKYFDFSFNAGFFGFGGQGAILSLDLMYKKAWNGGAIFKAGFCNTAYLDPYDRRFVPYPSIAIGFNYPKKSK